MNQRKNRSLFSQRTHESQDFELLKMKVVIFYLFLLSTGNALLTSTRKYRNVSVLYNNLPKFSFEGPRQVDMNMYNIPLETIEHQWSASIVPSTLDEKGGIYLSARDQREYFVDTIVVTLKRPVDEPLGIVLQEIAGGRDDGVGITVISGLVEGGYMESMSPDIQVGDSISKITLLRDDDVETETGDFLRTVQEEIIATTECLSYDATLEAIQKLPPSASHRNEKLIFTLKRLLRKPKVKVNLKYPPNQKDKDCTIELFAGENLRMGLLSRSVSVNDILAKRFDGKEVGGNCGGSGGLCRTCAVSVLRGGELLSPIKVAETQMLQDNPRWRLACRAYVGNGMKEGEITIQVFPKQLSM